MREKKVAKRCVFPMFCGSDFFSGGAELFLAFFFTVLDFFLGFVPGVIATTNLSYRIPIFETSATTLCGTTVTSNISNYECDGTYGYKFFDRKAIV